VLRAAACAACPGKAQRFARQGSHAAPDDVEIRPLIEDATVLAGRIAARLGAYDQETDS